MFPSTHHHPRAWVAAAALAVCLPAAWAAGPDKAAIESAYQRDRAACQALSPTRDRTSCLRDAGAHRAQALRSGIRGGASPQDLERNALQRCQKQTGEQRTICERMARGEGSVSGSVQGGGTIRELVTQETLPVPPPSPPQMPAPVLSPPLQPATPPLQPATPSLQPAAPMSPPPSMNPAPAPLPPANPPLSR